MTADEIKEGLLTLEAQHPFYQALMGLLEGDIEEEQGMVTGPGLADGERQYRAGRLAHAVDIRRAVEGVIREARAEREAKLRAAERKARGK